MKKRRTKDFPKKDYRRDWLNQYQSIQDSLRNGPVKIIKPANKK